MSQAQVPHGGAGGAARGWGRFVDVQLNVQGCVWNVALGLWVLGAHQL